MVQASSAPPTETISPTLISVAPQGPTAAANTWAIEGFFICASSCCGTTPSDSTETQTSNSRVTTKPSRVARLTSAACRAWLA